jgi:hypothetical protein
VGGGFQNRAEGSNSVVVGGACNTTSGCYSFVVNGFCNSNDGLRSGILGGQLNNTCGFADVMILGSCICADRTCATFVNNLSIKNLPNSSAGLPAGAVWVDIAGGCILKVV